MPADPEDVKGASHWLSALLGLGGTGVLAKMIFGYSASQNRLSVVETTVSDHGKRIDAMERKQDVLVERSEVAVKDRASIMNQLDRIEDKLP